MGFFDSRFVCRVDKILGWFAVAIDTCLCHSSLPALFAWSLVVACLVPALAIQARSHGLAPRIPLLDRILHCAR
ncbi:hypothetical protein BDW69DRAFT_176337 [Aspergillus filifer]